MFLQNLSPLIPNVEIGIASLQSVVVLLASKNVAYFGQPSSKNACTNVKPPMAHKKAKRKIFLRFMFHFSPYIISSNDAIFVDHAVNFCSEMG